MRQRPANSYKTRASRTAARKRERAGKIRSLEFSIKNLNAVLPLTRTREERLHILGRIKQLEKEKKRLQS